jgi:hypothetical protein
VNDDWADFLHCLLAAHARFLVIGAHALAVHGVPRATQDLDVWISRHPDNVRAVISALAAFGAPLEALGISSADLERDNQVIQLGVPPNRIDVLTSISGVPDFEPAWMNRTEQLVRGHRVPFIGRGDLVSTKRASGRKKDLGDLELLGEL